MFQLSDGFCIFREQIANAAFCNFKLLIQQFQALGKLQANNATIPIKARRQTLVSALDEVGGTAFIGNRVLKHSTKIKKRLTCCKLAFFCGYLCLYHSSDDFDWADFKSSKKPFAKLFKSSTAFSIFGSPFLL